MTRTPRRRIAALAALAALALPAALLAHAVVFPETAPTGAYQKYVLRVPTEREVPTTRIEIRFPEEVTVVSFADVPGWRLEVRTDDAGRVTGAAWSGSLPARRFAEFPFVAVNPREDVTVAWPVTQTYDGGEVVDWAGPEGSESPASVTRIRAEGTTVTTWLAGMGVVLALVALGLALRRSAPDPAA